MGTFLTLVLIMLGIAGVIAVLYCADLVIEKIVRLFVPAREDMSPNKTRAYQQSVDPMSFF